MKKLLLALLTVGALGAVAWLTRDRLLPPPAASTEPPSRFRAGSGGAVADTSTSNGSRSTPQMRVITGHAEATPPVEPTPDDLEEINGIGPVYAQRLADEGLTTFHALAAADPADTALRIDVTESMVSDWVDQAKERSH